MFKLMTWEHESSLPISRTFFDLCTAYRLAKGGYYKSQIIDENNVIIYEFK
jgi:hypothetical protein